jgi:hypothetical protein
MVAPHAPGVPQRDTAGLCDWLLCGDWCRQGDRESADAIEAARIALEPLVQTDGIVAVHLGIAKQPARVHPIELGGAAEDRRGHEELVLLVECLDTVKATLMVDAALGLLRKTIGAFQSNGETLYEIASWFDRSQPPEAAAPRASGQPRRRR